jgi:CHAT domain
MRTGIVCFSRAALSRLVRAFFSAGARALLVSHWTVDSAATVKLITPPSAPPHALGRAEALRRAMLSMIDKGEPHEAHPAYSAPFVVVGEGGVSDTIVPKTIGVASTKPKMATRKPRPKGNEPWTVEIWKKQ